MKCVYMFPQQNGDEVVCICCSVQYHTELYIAGMLRSFEVGRLNNRLLIWIFLVTHVPENRSAYRIFFASL